MTGKYFEDLEVGEHMKHPLGRTITEMDNVLFCSLTMNPQPLHFMLSPKCWRSDPPAPDRKRESSG
jgi:hypothetical protein